jgi:hypothetical protein
VAAEREAVSGRGYSNNNNAVGVLTLNPVIISVSSSVFDVQFEHVKIIWFFAMPTKNVLFLQAQKIMRGFSSRSLKFIILHLFMFSQIVN